MGAKHPGGADADRSSGGLEKAPEIDAREQSGFLPLPLWKCLYAQFVQRAVWVADCKCTVGTEYRVQYSHK